MGTNWAITIGINRYSNLQALNYAKRDAEAMQTYLQEDLKCQKSYHFSDNSPPIPQDYGPDLNSQPTYATLRESVRTGSSNLTFLAERHLFPCFSPLSGLKHLLQRINSL